MNKLTHTPVTIPAGSRFPTHVRDGIKPVYSQLADEDIGTLALALAHKNRASNTK